MGPYFDAVLTMIPKQKTATPNKTQVAPSRLTCPVRKPLSGIRNGEAKRPPRTALILGGLPSTLTPHLACSERMGHATNAIPMLILRFEMVLFVDWLIDEAWIRPLDLLPKGRQQPIFGYEDGSDVEPPRCSTYWISAAGCFCNHWILAGHDSRCARQGDSHEEPISESDPKVRACPQSASPVGKSLSAGPCLLPPRNDVATKARGICTISAGSLVFYWVEIDLSLVGSKLWLGVFR